jgi:hypothetical protein
MLTNGLCRGQHMETLRFIVFGMSRKRQDSDKYKYLSAEINLRKLLKVVLSMVTSTKHVCVSPLSMPSESVVRERIPTRGPLKAIGITQRHIERYCLSRFVTSLAALFVLSSENSKNDVLKINSSIHFGENVKELAVGPIME